MLCALRSRLRSLRSHNLLNLLGSMQGDAQCAQCFSRSHGGGRMFSEVREHKDQIRKLLLSSRSWAETLRTLRRLRSPSQRYQPVSKQHTAQSTAHCATHCAVGRPAWSAAVPAQISIAWPRNEAADPSPTPPPTASARTTHTDEAGRASEHGGGGRSYSRHHA